MGLQSIIALDSLVNEMKQKIPFDIFYNTTLWVSGILHVRCYNVKSEINICIIVIRGFVFQDLLIRGIVVWFTVVRGTVIWDNAVKSNIIWGIVIGGNAIRGNFVWGYVVQGPFVRGIVILGNSIQGIVFETRSFEARSLEAVSVYISISLYSRLYLWLGFILSLFLPHTHEQLKMQNCKKTTFVPLHCRNTTIVIWHFLKVWNTLKCNRIQLCFLDSRNTVGSVSLWFT